MKLSKIVGAHNVIESFANKEEIGAHLAYILTKFYTKTQADVDFFNKRMQELLKKYSVEEENGNIKVSEEYKADLERDVNELQDTEAEDPGIRFSLKELSDELKLTISQMYLLMDFIEEDQ